MKFLTNVKYKSLILVVASAFAWGIFAHGSGIFNLYTVGDAIWCLDEVGGTIASGRWNLWIMHAIELVFRGAHQYTCF